MGAVGLVLLAGAVIVSDGKGEGTKEEGERFLEAEIVTVGMDYITGFPVVLLRELEDGRTIPIWIGWAEAQAILQALHQIETPRPMTHDLTVALLGSVGVQVDEVVVRDMRNGTYFGSIYLRAAGRDDRVEVDCRPSDGLALAARSDAKIKVASKILGEAPRVDFMPPPGVEQVVQVLGLTIVPRSAEWQQEFDLPETEGLVVSGVQQQAAELGFRRGDLILRVNGQQPSTPMEFLEEFMRTQSGRPVRVEIWRDGIEKEISLPSVPEPAPGPVQTVPI